MFNLNKVVLIGTSTADSKVVKTGKNTVHKLSLALNRSWLDKNKNWQKQVTFVNVDFWGEINKIAKGSLVYVEGSLHTNSWEDEDGNKRSILIVKANVVKNVNLQKSNKVQSEEEVVSTPF